MDVYIETHNWDIEEIVTTQCEADPREGVFAIRRNGSPQVLLSQGRSMRQLQEF